MEQTKPKTVSAVVVGKSGDKSVKVSIDYSFRHAKYGKFLRRTTRLIVHDERNEAGVGDVVEIAEARPYSGSKTWRLVRIVQKALQEQVRADQAI